MIPAAIGPVGWLRIAARVLAMLGWLVVCVLFVHVWKLAARRDPWPRRFLIGIGKIVNVRITVNGTRSPGREVLLANHVSWIDVPAIGSVAGAAFVAHDGLAGVPLIRWICAMNDTVFVARHDRASVARQIEQVRAAISASGALAIFPEGTTNDGNNLLPFKSSLLSALDPLPPGLAVQPLLLDYGPDFADIAWTGEEHGLTNFLKILARSAPVDLGVHFLAPLERQALASRKTIAAATQNALFEKLRELR